MDNEAYLFFLRLKMVESFQKAEKFGKYTGQDLGEMVCSVLLAQSYGRAAQILETDEPLGFTEALKKLTDCIDEQRGIGPAINAFIDAIATRALIRVH